MTDRKHEHVEPREIAGSDLPSYVGNRSPFRGLVHAFFPALILWGIVAVALWQLWVYRASVLAQFGWML